MISNNRITHIDKNGDTSTQTVSNPTYDVFGNVIADNRPGTAADMTYTYDTLHGWLTGVSSPCGFSEQLLRETATNAQYSGNIGRMLWRNTANGEQHRYDYTYDSLGRLTSSQYSSSANGTADRYNESVTYNPNGSIMSLLRNGMKNDGTFGAIDDLTITYDGNRLLKVTDDAESLNYNGALDFDDGDDSTTEYHYDGNGALTSDSNRGINKITYDYSHYPSLIARVTKKKTVYNEYTPEGRKLYSLHVSYFPKGNRTYYRISIKDLYIDGLILRSDTALLWKFSGGYVELNANGTPTSWNYYITDHLGSTRMVVDSNNNIKETVNYYPFGSEMKMEDPALLTGGTSHPYRFTGKELDKLNSLNMYDFGARWYDVAGVPIWTSVDPLAEKYYNISPYAYCNNNPVNAIDPEGKDIYMLFYTTRNPQGDEMFKAAAETRKYDIEHSKGFNSENDIVLLNSIEDISDLNTFVNNIVDTYSSNFGKTIEFGIWSHSGIDGPIGSISTSLYALEGTQMSMEGWSNIHFNWADNASATFYGCRGGISENGNTSFTTKVSGLNNFKDVYVYGQTAYSYPSQYTNVRRISLDMMRNNYSYPTYMVGGIKGNGAKSLLFGLRAYPMRISRNGFGIVGNYYQPGRIY